MKAVFGLCLILLCALLLCSAGIYRRTSDPTRGERELDKGCLVVATGFEQALAARAELESYRVWSHIVRLDYGRGHESHAVVIYALKNGDVYCYDNMHGSVPMETRTHDWRWLEAIFILRDPRVQHIEYLD